MLGKKLFLLLGVLTCFLVQSCSSTGSPASVETTSGSKIQVVTTIAPLSSLVKNVGGDLVSVRNLVPIGASEHTFQARPSDLQNMAQAHLVFKNGLGLELFLEGILREVPPSVKVIDTSSGARILKTRDLLELEEHTSDHEEVHEHTGGADPHIWLSISNALIQVENIKNALSAYAPEHAAEFSKNAAEYAKRLSALRTELKEQLAPLEKKPYIVFHDGYQYFEDEFGLAPVGVIEPFPGKEPSAAYVRALYALIEEKKVRVLFSEPQFSPKLIEQLALRFGLSVGALDTIGTTMDEASYETLMRNNGNAFLSTFSKS